MKNLFYILILLLGTKNISAQSNGPIGPIKSGYGSIGKYSIDTVKFPSPMYSGKFVDVFFPVDSITFPRPTIFFSHGFGGDNPLYYAGIIQNLVSNGYVVVFSPYPSSFFNPQEQYNTLFTGFVKAVDTFKNIIDSTKVGFMGHSFGAGACPSMAYRGIVQHAWGKNGAFIFPMAQFYSYEISQEQLKEIPNTVKLISQVYDKDATCDHRMAIDIFNNLEIPNSEKDFVILHSDTVDSYAYTADHGVPTISKTNALDYYGIYKLVDALADYTFTDDTSAKSIALGNGSKKQIYMGESNSGDKLKEMTVTDYPIPFRAGNTFTYSCQPTTAPNPRSIYCPDDFTSIENNQIDAINLIYPNPNNGNFSIKMIDQSINKISILNSLGQLIFEKNGKNLGGDFEMKNIHSGMYLIVLSSDKNIFLQKMLIE